MAEPVNRREFWKKGLLRMLYAAGILGMAYPVMSFITFKKTRKRAVVFQPGEQKEIPLSLSRERFRRVG